MKKLGARKFFRGKDVEETCRVNEQNPEQESLSGESGVEEIGRVEEQDLENRFLSGEFRWMSRTHRSEPGVETKLAPWHTHQLTTTRGKWKSL